jgi:heme/copper-type cytochrome/quinol oxidase subunit 2
VDNTNSAATASFLAGFILVYVVIIVGVLAFTIWAYWRMFEKAGFSGAMSLLNLIPGFGPLICLIVLAFGRWPIEEELTALRAANASRVPPGSSVMPAP